MPRLFASDDDRDLVRAERDVRAAFTGLDLDLTSLAAVSSIFRAATAVRNHMESGVLERHELSWSAFTTLFVLRVWGEMDARSLAYEAGVTAATLTGVMKTLEARQLLRKGVVAVALSPTTRPGLQHRSNRSIEDRASAFGQIAPLTPDEGHEGDHQRGPEKVPQPVTAAHDAEDPLCRRLVE